MQKLILSEGIINDDLLKHEPLASFIAAGYEVKKFEAFSSNDNKHMCYALIDKDDHVSTPTIDVDFTEGDVKVSLECSTHNAKIYYTTDETTPTSASNEYDDTLTLTEATTLKCIAIKDGVASEVVTATIKIGS